MISRHLLALSMAVTAASCDTTEPGDTVFDIVFDPCQPLVVVPADDTSPAERASIEAAVAMWNERAGSRLVFDDVAGAPRLPIGFEDAPGAFYGVYEDELGRILINRRLSDSSERTITIAHEVGHAFDLRHVDRDERTSLMNTPNLTTELQDGDVEVLRALWGACGEGAPVRRGLD
jgi:hypothetical protein